MTRDLAPFRMAALATAACAFLTACNNNLATQSSVYATEAKARAAGKPGLSDTTALLALAERIAAAGDHAAAIPLYQRAHDARPHAPEPLLGLGRSLAATGRLMAAREAFERAVGRDKSNPAALAALGNMLLQTNRTQDGLAFLDNALALDPELPEALRGKASALDLLGRHDEALALYATALSVAPRDPRTLNNYGLSLALHNAPDAGIAVLEDALRQPDLGAAGPALRQNLALAYLVRGRTEDARRMIAIDHGHSGVEQRMQDLYLVTALPAANRLAALIEGSRGSVAVQPATPEGLNARQVAALRSIGAEKVRVATLQAPETSTVETSTVETGTAETTTVATAAPAPRAIVAAPAPTPAPAARPTKVSMAGANGRSGWIVQLAAYRKADQFTAEWKRFTARHGDLLAGLSPSQSEVNFGTDKAGPSGVYYRLTAGPLQSRSAAKDLCATLETRGTGCIVRHLPAAPRQLAAAN